MKNPFNIKNSIIGAFTGFVNGLFGSGGGTLGEVSDSPKVKHP